MSNTWGCRANAAERLAPWSTVLRTSPSTRLITRLLVSSCSNLRPRCRLLPPLTMVANWRENRTSSPVLTLNREGNISSNPGRERAGEILRTLYPWPATSPLASTSLSASILPLMRPSFIVYAV